MKQKSNIYWKGIPKPNTDSLKRLTKMTNPVQNYWEKQPVSALKGDVTVNFIDVKNMKKFY